MAMPVRLPTYTTDDLRAFPDDGCRYELLNGTLLVTPQAANAHQVVVSRVFAALQSYLGQRGPAVVVTPGVIEIAPSVHLEPDLLVYPARFGPRIKWPAITGWWLAVEVSGRTSRRYDRDYKRGAYLDLGVREVWLVDLDEQCVRVACPRTRRDRRLTSQLHWHPHEMPDPLMLDLAELFRGFEPAP